MNSLTEYIIVNSELTKSRVGSTHCRVGYCCILTIHVVCYAAV